MIEAADTEATDATEAVDSVENTDSVDSIDRLVWVYVGRNTEPLLVVYHRGSRPYMLRRESAPQCWFRVLLGS